jgi:Amt family ammonium transporter
MNFLAWMIFVPLWLTFSYTIGAFSLWAGGFLFKLGVIDYSGGYVIHLSSGTAGFVGALVIGPRLDADRQDKRPNNTLLVLVGAGILWIGWNGFNGGDPVRPLVFSYSFHSDELLFVFLYSTQQARMLVQPY